MGFRSFGSFFAGVGSLWFGGDLSLPSVEIADVGLAPCFAVVGGEWFGGGTHGRFHG